MIKNLDFFGQSWSNLDSLLTPPVSLDWQSKQDPESPGPGERAWHIKYCSFYIGYFLHPTTGKKTPYVNQTSGCKTSGQGGVSTVRFAFSQSQHLSQLPRIIINYVVSHHPLIVQVKAFHLIPQRADVWQLLLGCKHSVDTWGQHFAVENTLWYVGINQTCLVSYS